MDSLFLDLLIVPPFHHQAIHFQNSIKSTVFSPVSIYTSNHVILLLSSLSTDNTAVNNKKIALNQQAEFDPHSPCTGLLHLSRMLLILNVQEESPKIQRNLGGKLQ